MGMSQMFSLSIYTTDEYIYFFVQQYNVLFLHNFFFKCGTFAFALRFPWSVRPFLGLLTPALKSENLQARSDFVSSLQACLYIPARLFPSAFRNPSPILLGAEKPFCWQLLNINDACARNGAPAQNITHAGFPDYTLYAVTFLPCICSLFCFFSFFWKRTQGLSGCDFASAEFACTAARLHFFRVRRVRCSVNFDGTRTFFDASSATSD